MKTLTDAGGWKYRTDFYFPGNTPFPTSWETVWEVRKTPRPVANASVYKLRLCRSNFFIPEACFRGPHSPLSRRFLNMCGFPWRSKGMLFLITSSSLSVNTRLFSLAGTSPTFIYLFICIVCESISGGGEEEFGAFRWKERQRTSRWSSECLFWPRGLKRTR